MSDDLDAFLRQAAQRRAQKTGATSRPVPPPPQTPQPAAPPRAPAPARTPRQADPAVPTRATPRKAPDRLVATGPLGSGEESRLGTRVSTSEIEQHVRHLAEEISQADEHMEAHLARSFDHQVGSQVATQPLATAAPGAETDFDLDGLQAMLANPNSLRQAVVLSEILRRPEWDENAGGRRDDGRS